MRLADAQLRDHFSGISIKIESGFDTKKSDHYLSYIQLRDALRDVITAQDALKKSIADKAVVDLDYMCKLTDKSEKGILDELRADKPDGEIFYDLESQTYQTRAIFLSGDVFYQVMFMQKQIEKMIIKII